VLVVAVAVAVEALQQRLPGQPGRRSSLQPGRKR
jgi:hypothetical protein